MVILLIVSLQVLVEWEDESMTLAPGEVSLRAFPNTILQDHADHSEAVPQKRPDLWRVSAAGVEEFCQVELEHPPTTVQWWGRVHVGDGCTRVA